MDLKKQQKPTYNVSGKEQAKLGTFNGFTVGYFELYATDRLELIKKIQKIKTNYQSWINVSRMRLQKIGFKWKRTALIFTDLSKTAEFKARNATGSALSHAILVSPSESSDVVISTIIHEWSHLWLFDQSEEIKKQIEQLRQSVKKSYGWNSTFSEYSLTNLDEFWVFLVTRFETLPKKYQDFVKEIVFLGN